MIGVQRMIDAHHHLWDPEEICYPWLAAGQPRFFGDPARLPRPYLVADFCADFDPLPVRSSVHLQVGAKPEESVDETRWLQSIADDHGLPSAVVAYCNLAASDAAIELDAHRQSSCLRGIRQIIGRSRLEGDAGPGLLDCLSWRRGLALLAERGLSFDLQVIPGQLVAARRVFAEWPELAVALCHAGSPGDAGPEGFDPWRRDLHALAKLPNICCKLSGFVMFDHHWTADSMRPYILAAIDAFGPERCMFGSNFPVDGLYADYVGLWQAYLQVLEEFTSDERDAMLYRTAARFYRVGS